MTAAPDSPLATLWCPAPNRRAEAERPRGRHAPPALHRHGDRRGRARLADAAGVRRVVPLFRRRGRAHRAARGGVRARLACRPKHAGPARPTSIPARSASRSTIPDTSSTIRISPRPQMRAVEALCRDILSRHAIPPDRVLAHSDVAPGPQARPRREIRLGAARPRRRRPLGAAGADRGRSGPRPRRRRRAVAALQRDLLAYGYGVEVTSTYGTGLEKVVEAFQRHFRTARIDGRADRSTRRHAGAPAGSARRDGGLSPGDEVA